ncbi:MAG: SOS response-associated peptidase [Eubacteriaceae bacterium]|nr:SOS response-associated peptidase [Eubacteriaceae bacterium]
MCGRFLVPENLEEFLIKNSIRKEGAITDDKGRVKYPSMLVPVIVYDDRKKDKKLMVMKWGWLFSGTKKILINARNESIFKKGIYKDSVKNKRCVIPAEVFYEWDDKKNKYTIGVKDSPVIALAGLYKTFIDDKKNLYDAIVIVTQDSNEELSTIHQRMPLILQDDDIETWLHYDILSDEEFNKRFVKDKAFSFDIIGEQRESEQLKISFE